VETALLEDCGACYLSDEYCVTTSEDICVILGGAYQGDGTVCPEEEVPTVTEQGLIIMVLALLTVGAVVIARRRRLVAA